MRLKLEPRQRLRKKKSFQTVFKQGRCYKGKLLNLWIYRAGTQAKPVFGIIVSKKTAAKSVQRNKWKRRIKEILRKLQHSIEPDAVLIVQARPAGADAAIPLYPELESEILQLCTRGKILR